ncbi:MAG TPA: hypothetical protein P5096_01380 [Patescibacteria group bacterium]|nr:hypothetical protein [Patescibacteria group bacterium]
MENILISNPEKLQEKIEKFRAGRAEAIHVVSDFDKTVTRAFHGNEKFPSVISLLRDGNHLTPDYAERAHELYNKYHPYEIDLSLPFEKRKSIMDAWWNEHFALLIECGLEKKDLEDIVGSGRISFRDCAKEFFNILNKNGIPLVFISSNVVGNTILMILEKEGMMNENIHIITNIFEFDESGRATKVLEPKIHVLNKSEIAVKDHPIFEKIMNRKNVILLGDGIDDNGMIEGFQFDEVIRIGFLNEKVEENKNSYLKNFDVVITNDGDMGYINELMKKILE